MGIVLSVELSFTNIVIFGILYFCGLKVWDYYKALRLRRLLERWSDAQGGKVILHAIPRGKQIPSISPFCLKLETYLRFANIPYEYESSKFLGPKGMTPWISFKGTHMEDTQLIIQFLNKKFDIDLNKYLSSDRREICRAARIMLENNLFFGLLSWRWVEDISSITKIFRVTPIMVLILPFRVTGIEKSLKAHGLGLHGFSERHELTIPDLRTVGTILGTNKFMGGDEPCEEDCSIFAFLSQAIYGAPGSPYESVIQNELPNLKEYCDRMKNKFWPDWDSCLDKAKDYFLLS